MKHLGKLEITAKAPSLRLAAFVVLLLSFSTTAFGVVFSPSDLAHKKAKITIEKMFGKQVVLHPFERDANYYSIFKNDSLIAYYCIENAPSKHDEFEFMVVYDASLNIQKVHVLVYREDYGFEIKSKRWLQQFSIRKVDSVQAISGATISVNSLKSAVERLNQKMAATLL